MTTTVKNAIIFGLGLAIGMALGNTAMDWVKTNLS